MDPGGEDWSGILARLEAGDRTACLRFQRLITGFLLELRAFDFEDEWDDLRQEVLAAVVANARAGPAQPAGLRRLRADHHAQQVLRPPEATAARRGGGARMGGGDGARARPGALWQG